MTFHENLQEFQSPAFLEKKLLHLFSLEDLDALGLPHSVYPKILRGLPRIYKRDNPSQAYIKKNFHNIFALKRHCIDKAILHLYDHISPQNHKLTIFTWVMNDGLGDYYTGAEIATLLKEKVPDTAFLALLHKSAKVNADPKWTLYYDKNEEVALPLITEPFLQRIRSSHLVLQTPTFFPDTPSLLQNTRHELLGQYGFIESPWCHPETEHRCMGLHFLEKGILVKKIAKRGMEALQQLENQELAKELDPSHSLNLAYFTTPEGAYLYLHALLKKRGHDATPLTLVISNIGPLLEAIQHYVQQGDSFPLFHRYGIKEVQISFEGSLCKIPISSEGKLLRLIQAKNLSQSDFETLMVLSSDLVACRGDRSFSEAVSADKIYFYDAPYHSRNFLKDLIAIAENRLHKGCADYLRTFLPPLHECHAPYVEEEYFHTKEDNLPELGEKIGALLSDPQVIAGLHHLNKILYHEYAANRMITQLVARSFLHHQNPEIQRVEGEIIDSFLREEITFLVMIVKLRALLS